MKAGHGELVLSCPYTTPNFWKKGRKKTFSFQIDCGRAFHAKILLSKSLQIYFFHHIQKIK